MKVNAQRITFSAIRIAMTEPISARIRKARIRANISSVKEAAERLGVPYATYAAHENGSRIPNIETLVFYAKRYQISVNWLATGAADPVEAQGLRRVTVKAHVQAGLYAESWEWADSDAYDVYVEDLPELQGFRLYAAETRGPSMNRKWPERTIVVFTDVQETLEDPIPGKRYVVERERTDGQTEHTVKLLHLDEDGRYWLVPESDDPRYQAPISVDDGLEGETVRIVGRVHFAVSRE